MELGGGGVRLIGMVHLAALPGTPGHGLRQGEMVARACEDALALRAAGFDALLVENMHDRPYVRGGAGPEVVAAMTLACRAVAECSGLPCGVQVLAGANAAALAIAAAVGLAFVRVEGFVFAHVGDEGLHEACAGELLRYRKLLGAEGVMVYADIKKKHSAHALTADVDLAETARAAEFFLADGVIITGARTGQEPELAAVLPVREATRLPILIGSGVTAGNVRGFLTSADAVICGSDVKELGDWRRGVCPERARALVAAARR